MTDEEHRTIAEASNCLWNYAQKMARESTESNNSKVQDYLSRQEKVINDVRVRLEQISLDHREGE